MAVKQNRTDSSPKNKASSPVFEEDESTKNVRYIDLWKKGIEMGLISASRPSKPEYYHMIYRKSLISRMNAYREASTKDDKARLAASFERNLRVQCEKKAKEEKESGSNGNYQARLMMVPPSGYQAPVWPAMTTAASRRSIPEHKKDKKPRIEEEYSEISACLVGMWQRALDSGYISPENTFHRGMVGFITPSELFLLLKQCSATDKVILNFSFNEEIATFNANIPSAARYFKVSRSYAQVWEKARSSGLIPESVTYNPEYVEWVSSKDLIAYTYTLKTILSRDDRASARVILYENNIKPKLEFADSCLQYRAQLASYSCEDLVKECEKYRPAGSIVNAYSQCKHCTSLLVKTDIIAALSSWVFCSEEEINLRYLRWHNFRLTLHSVVCHNEEASAKFMSWKLSRETPLAPTQTED